jgi:predicted HTH transcriptional regulator
MSNSDYRRMNRIDALRAGQELRGLVHSGVVEQSGVGRGTYYSLKAPKNVLDVNRPETDEEKILAHVQEHGSISNKECRELLKVDLQRASYLLKKLTKKRSLRSEGKGRWRRYRIV